MTNVKTTISPEYQDSSTVQNFVKNLPNIFIKEGAVLYDKRNIIKSFVLDPSDKVLGNVVVKRYKRPNLIQRLIYSFFRASKAKRAFHNATELCNRGIATPREVSYIELWSNGLFSDGYYISATDDAPPIREKLINQLDFDRIMAKDFADFVANLHEKGILHHDLNSTNVLYHIHGAHYRFSVIDINRMHFFTKGEQPSRKECFENLTRFTGRMDLFEYVLCCYVEKRKWNETAVFDAINIKIKHDEQWRRRKAFFRKLSMKRK